MTTWARRLAPALLVLGGVAAPVAVTATPSGAATCTHTWKDPVDGRWFDETKWSTGTAPLFGGDVCITVPGDYTVSGLQDDAAQPFGVYVDSVQLGATTGTGTQELVYTSMLHATQFEIGDLDIAARGLLTFQGTTPNGGPYGIVLDDGQSISNGGTISVPPAGTGTPAVAMIDGDVENTAAGRIEVAERLTLSESSLVNDGTIEVDGPLEVQDELLGRSGTVSGGVDPEDRVVVTGTAILEGIETSDASGSQIAIGDGESGGTASLELVGDTDLGIDLRGSTVVSGDVPPRARLVAAAELEWSSAVWFDGTVTNHGTISARNGSTIGRSVELHPATASSELVNEGTIEIGAGEVTSDPVVANVPIENRGTITLGDDLDVWRDLRNEGLIDLGTATLDQSNGDQPIGSLVLAPSGTVAVEVADAGPGTAYRTGRLTRAGAIALAGTLAVTTSADPAPPVGTQLPVVSGPSRTGAFADVTFSGPASYDAAYTATEARIARRASESATRRFVRAAHQDFLGRQPSGTELGQKATAIDGGTLTRATLVRQLSLSTEYVTALVQRFYTDTLGRPGEPGGVAFWVDQLRTGRKTVAQVAGSFYASEEYYGRLGGIDGAWIDDLYGVFFGRPPSSGDRTYWVGRIQARGRTQVAIELFQSLESRRQRVHQVYRDLLGRDGDAAGVDFWAGRITREGDLALAVNLAASSEYLQRAQVRYP